MRNRDSDPWYVAERAEALAHVCLTRHPDVHVVERHSGEDATAMLSVDVRHRGLSSRSYVAVQVRGFLGPAPLPDAHETVQSYNGRSAASMLPTCVLVFEVREGTGSLAWLVQPFLDDGGRPKLKAVDAPVFHDLTRAELDRFVQTVNHWYAALTAALAA